MNKIKLNYISLGNKLKPSILFIHPLGVDHTIFNVVMNLMSDDFHCIAVDIRGHGKSPILEMPYSIDEMAQDISSTFQFDEPVNVMGVSIGGMISISLAIQKIFPIRKLILSDTGHVIGNHELWQERIDLVKTGGLEKIVDIAIERWFPEEFRIRSTEIINECKALQLNNSIKGYIGACMAIQKANFTNELTKINCETLVINGSKDISTPPALGKELASLISNSSFQILDGIGHVPPLQDPVLTVKILNAFFSNS